MKIMFAFQLPTMVSWNYKIIVRLPSYDYVHDIINRQAFFVCLNIQCLINLEYQAISRVRLYILCELLASFHMTDSRCYFGSVEVS